MKKYQNFSLLTITILGIVLLFSSTPNGFAQNEKNKIRISADFVNVQDKEQFINIKAIARIDKQTVEVSNAEFDIFQVINDEETEIGKTITSANGTSKFIIKDFNSLQADSSGTYNLSIVFSGNDAYKKASKDLSFKKAEILAEMVTRDSVNYVTAKLIDRSTDSVLTELPLNVQVQRLFRPLKIGEDFYTTDENGQIEVAVEDGIPGIDGNLILEVVLKENDDYGTVKALVHAPIGKVVVSESTFEQRTMWSPRGKTPIFLLFLTFSFIIIVWGLFVYLIRNLFKIVKS
jgi:hypothetical protein